MRGTLDLEVSLLAARTLLASVTLLLGCHRATEENESLPPVTVRCHPPTRETIEETVALRGRVAPPPGGDLPIASQVPGRVVGVSVVEGQTLTKGTVIATVDDLASRDALRQADAAVVAAKASVANAEISLERTKSLVAKGIAPKQELDDAIARTDAAHAAYDAASAGADLARRTLGRVAVRTSFDGVVTKLWRGPGALVDGTAATPIVQVAAVGALEFLADATERELATIAVGQASDGVLGGSDQKTLAGVVHARSASIDAASGLGFVRIALTSSGDAVVGAYGRFVVHTGTRVGVLVVPSEAIRGSVSDGAEVAICKDGKAEIRTITVGHRDERFTEVLSGLGETELIALDHVLGLENDTVIVVSPEKTEKTEKTEKEPEPDAGTSSDADTGPKK